MKEQNNQKTHKKANWGVRSVYAALGVCLVAVAAAAWTTFESISSTLSANTPDVNQSQIEETEGALETLSGVTDAEESAQQSDLSSEEESQTDETADAAAATPETLSAPLSNGILQAYSGETLVYSNTMKDWRVHSGTDFQAELGESVVSMCDGTVTKVYDDGLLGNVVVVEAGTLEISYCGLDADISVTQGEAITAGQTIGVVGQIPAEQADGPHLHLELKQDGAYQDVESMLG